MTTTTLSWPDAARADGGPKRVMHFINGAYT